MALKIELHDSQIEKIVANNGRVEIFFDSLVVLNVTDEFGFEFDKTSYHEGSIVIANAKYEKLPEPGEVSSGYIQVKDCRYNLIDTSFKSSSSSVLFISQEMNSCKIFGSGISVFIKR